MGDGIPRLLDLLIHRVNARWASNREGRPVSFFKTFLQALQKWTVDPLSDFSRVVPTVLDQDFHKVFHASDLEMEQDTPVLSADDEEVWFAKLVVGDVDEMVDLEPDEAIVEYQDD